jgi:hypothetical protein
MIQVSFTGRQRQPICMGEEKGHWHLFKSASALSHFDMGT